MTTPFIYNMKGRANIKKKYIIKSKPKIESRPIARTYEHKS